MIFSGKLYDVGEKFKLNRFRDDGFDVPFYIGLIYSNIDEHGNRVYNHTNGGAILHKSPDGVWLVSLDHISCYVQYQTSYCKHLAIGKSIYK